MSDYVRYGPEWEREVMRNPKQVIVEMLREVAIERDALQDKKCPECESEICVCMMGHYCGEIVKS